MKFTLYVGTNYNGGTFSREQAKTIILDCMEFNGVNGGTIIDGVGVWNGENENTEIIEIYGGIKMIKKIINLVKSIKDNMYQYSVGFSFSVIPFFEIK